MIKLKKLTELENYAQVYEYARNYFWYLSFQGVDYILEVQEINEEVERLILSSWRASYEAIQKVFTTFCETNPEFKFDGYLHITTPDGRDNRYAETAKGFIHFCRSGNCDVEDNQ